MKKIYVLGNPLIEEDSLPIQLISFLKKEIPSCKFIQFDPTENLPEEEHLILIDTILNIKEIKVLDETQIDKIQSSPKYSLHDLDLAMQLKIAKKLGQLHKLTLIGIPPHANKQEKIKKIKSMLSALA